MYLMNSLILPLLGLVWVGPSTDAEVDDTDWVARVAVSSSLAGLQANRELEEPAQRLPSESGDLPSDAAVRAANEAFDGPEFWWKRQQKVQAPQPFERLWRPIRSFFKWVWSYVEPAIEAIGKFFSAIWNAIRNLMRLPVGGSYDTGTMVLLMLVLGAFAWLMWRVHPLVWQWLKATEPRKLNKANPSVVDQALPEPMALLELATAAIQASRLREALRFAFLSLLACLQNRGLLRYDPSRTNREYLDDLRDNPHLAVIFRETSRPYERAWYGLSDVTAAEAEQALGVCRHLMLQENSTP